MRPIFAFWSLALALAGCIGEGGVPATLVRDEEADLEKTLDGVRIHLGGADDPIRDAAAD